MIYKTDSPKVAHARVIFELPASLWADRGFVAGDFNQWSPTRTPLHQERDGAWRAVLDLPTGHHYQFHYLVNGERRTEFQLDSAAIVAAGLLSSLLILG